MPVIVVPTPALVLLVGAAGAGKSTFAAHNFQRDEVLSSDALRAALSGDEANQQVSRVVFRILHAKAAGRLGDGRRAVIDATNVRRSARLALLRLARAVPHATVPAIAIVFDLPLEDMLERNARRARRVDEAIVRRQAAILEAALRDGALEAEGFTLVVRLDSSAAAAALRVETVG